MIENTKKMKAGEVPLNRKKDEMTISTKKGKLTDFLNFITKGITPYLIISVIVFGVYFQTLSYGFIGFDDDTIINRNIVNINNTSVIKEAFTRDAFFTHEMGYYRPLLTLSFIFNKATTGDNLFYFHLTNLILHLILCYLLFYLLNLIKINKSLSLTLTLIFGVHPLFVNTVVWLVARNDLFVCVFLLSSLILLIKYENRKKLYFLPFHFLFYILALFSKEVSLIAPLIFIIYLTKFNVKKFIKKENIFIVIIWIVIAIPYLILRSYVSSGNENIRFSNFLTNLPFIPEIVCKFFLPFNLSGMPTYNIVLVIIGLILFLGLGYMVFKKTGKSYNFYLLFGLFWFIVFALPGMFTRYWDIGGFDYIENRSYLPIIGIVILLAYILNPIIQKKLILLFIFAFLALLFGMYNFLYSRNYSAPKNFYTGIIENGTKVALAYNNMGNIRKDNGDINGAIENYSKAIELKPDYADAYINRGTIRKNTIESLKDYNRALEINHENPTAYNNRGLLLVSLGDYNGGRNDYNRALALKPNFAEVYNNRGFLRKETGDFEGARQDFNRAIELKPDFPEAYNNRGIAKIELGDIDGAKQDYDKAILQKPDYVDAYLDRGNLWSKIRNFNDAMSDFKKCLEMKPDYVNAYNSIGTLYGKQGNHKEAYNNFEKALQINPNYLDAMRNLASAKLNMGDRAGACSLWEKAYKMGDNESKGFLEKFCK